jgi:phosphoesterase, MJ0936 family
VSVLVALADTHGTTTPRLTDHLRGVLDSADIVCHAGDLTTSAVLDALGSVADLRAVHGNSDEPTVQSRLPETRTVEWGGRRFVLAHSHRRDWTSLSLLARQENADVVVVGHTHRLWLGERGGQAVVNPGSHADPRDGRATYVLFERTEGGVVGHGRTVGGAPIETVEL